jgi:hypothetical protein
MTHSFDNPFLTSSSDPCPTGCDPSPSCLPVCGYDVNGCGPSGCTTLFPQIKFLNGYIAGFNSKLGFGGSESTLSVEIVFENNDCPNTSPNPSCSPCVTDQYDGHMGYIYSLCIGKFSFRGILTNHVYSVDNGGYRYRVTLSDGRNLMSNIIIILNSIYDRPPVKLEHNLLNALYFIEPSLDECDGEFKCLDFMKSGANKKGIFLKKAIEQLDGKQIQVPVSQLCLTLDFSNLIEIIPDTYRTNTVEMTLLDLVSLVCEETGYDFFVKITNDNKLLIIPVNYKQPVNNKPLLKFIDDLNKQDIVISKEYGEEMSFEKNKRIVYGDFYHYLTTVEDPLPSANADCVVNNITCTITNPPWTKLVTRNTDDPLEAFDSPEPSCI